MVRAAYPSSAPETPYARQAVVAAIEANAATGFAMLGRMTGGPIHETAHLHWFSSGLASPLCNGVVRSQLATQDVPAAIDAALQHFRARGEPLSWMVSPATQPSDLGRDLEVRGFVREADAPVMALDLRDLPPQVSCPPNLDIVRADTAALWQTWLGVLSVGFAAPPVCGTTLPLRTRPWLRSRVAPMRCYVGVLAGVPVATAMLVASDGIAGIHYVSTVPRARGGGIGTAVTWTALCDARAMGYRIGGLVATALGEGVYRRLGFRTCATFSFYDWSGD